MCQNRHILLLVLFHVIRTLGRDGLCNLGDKTPVQGVKLTTGARDKNEICAQVSYPELWFTVISRLIGCRPKASTTIEEAIDEPANGIGVAVDVIAKRTIVIAP